MNICKKCKFKKGYKWIKEQKRFAEFNCGIENSYKEECPYVDYKLIYKLMGCKNKGKKK